MCYVLYLKNASQPISLSFSVWHRSKWAFGKANLKALSKAGQKSSRDGLVPWFVSAYKISLRWLWKYFLWNTHWLKYPGFVHYSPPKYQAKKSHRSSNLSSLETVSKRVTGVGRESMHLRQWAARAALGRVRRPRRSLAAGPGTRQRRTAASWRCTAGCSALRSLWKSSCTWWWK